MDSLITAAGRALAAGDPLGALKLVALRDDAPALALRGIAMAQLGDFVKAKALLRGAVRGFGAKEPLARARCVVAQAEVALASRDLAFPAKTLEAARATLEAHGDRANAAHARYLEVRRLLLIGRLADAERALAKIPCRATAIVAGRARAGDCGHRDTAHPDEGRARGADARRAGRARSGYSGAVGRSRWRAARAEHHGRAAHRERRGHAAQARRGRSAARRPERSSWMRAASPFAAPAP